MKGANYTEQSLPRFLVHWKSDKHSTWRPLTVEGIPVGDHDRDQAKNKCVHEAISLYSDPSVQQGVILCVKDMHKESTEADNIVYSDTILASIDTA